MLIRDLSILMFILLFTHACKNSADNHSNLSTPHIIECDAETWIDNEFLDKNDLHRFTNADNRSSKESRSGNYALKLSQTSPYGMGSVWTDVQPGELFHVSVWIKGNGYLCASGNTADEFYQAENNFSITDENGWSRIDLNLKLPINIKNRVLRIYLSNTSEEPAYFDDLKIERKKEVIKSSASSADAINIFISDENFQKLKVKRDQAVEEGLLTRSEDDWVKAIIFHADQVLRTKIRLKGDRLDHLKGDKWSFRVKIRGEKAWNGMKQFSLQTPAARNYLHEWFFHKALEKEDLLHTRYGFVPVLVNGKSVGIYAWEEHFAKQLLESQNRREGPILKLTDESYWQVDKLKRKKTLDYSVPNYDASRIVPFGEAKTLGDTSLFSEFRAAQELYHRYKYAASDAGELFDLKALAKYYAMIDATNAYHTLQFFNQRFYYNPVLGKLEPIFFDSFSDVGIFDFFGSDLIIEEAETKWISQHLKAFGNHDFVEMYFNYLKKFSDRSYWIELYEENEEDINYYESVLRDEFTSYDFELETFLDIADKASIAGQSMQDLAYKKNIFPRFRERTMEVYTEYKGKADIDVLPHLVHIYKNGKNKFYIENFSTDTIIVTGMSDIKQLITENLTGQLKIPPANSSRMYNVNFNVEMEGHKYLFFTIRGKEYIIPVTPWEAPGHKAIPTEIVKNDFLDSLIRIGSIKRTGDTLVFSKHIVIDQHLIIPKDLIVKLEKGSDLDICNGATFISYSPVLSEGTESAPVIIRSSDHTAKGFNVFQANTRSRISYTQFSDLHYLKFDGWMTTGAVCFYESDVDLDQVTFEKNSGGDDALNIVRADFKLTNSTFNNSLADGFDSDFCTGQIYSTTFISPGNDAIDFSGSQVEIKDVMVSDAGDKIISCGEQSKIRIQDGEFNGARIGIAAKDKSEVEIQNSNFRNINYALVAFTKKPEYGSAIINASGILTENVIFLHLIEKGSLLKFNNREIFGQEKDLAKRFY